MKIKKISGLLKFFVSEDVIAITLYPFGIYVKEQPYPINPSTINHEEIHWMQQKELLCIFFYMWYFVEWLLRLPFGNAYMNISFEREAYANQNNPNYLKTRKKFGFLKYLL